MTGCRLVFFLALSLGVHIAILAIHLSREPAFFAPGGDYPVRLVTQNARNFRPVIPKAKPPSPVVSRSVSPPDNQKPFLPQVGKRRILHRVVSDEIDIPETTRQTQKVVRKAQIAEEGHVTQEPLPRSLPLPVVQLSSGSEETGAPQKRVSASAETISTELSVLPEPGLLPVYATNPRPVYPAVARRKGWTGKVLLLVQVDKNGKVCQLSVDKGSGYSVLDRAALRAVRRWRFVPPGNAGREMVSEVVIPIDFRLPSQ